MKKETVYEPNWMNTKDVLEYLNISSTTFNRYLQMDKEREKPVLPYLRGKNNAHSFYKKHIVAFKKHHLPKYKTKQVPVYVYDLNKVLVEEFENIGSCADYYNLKSSYIGEMLLKHTKYQKKYLFSRHKPYLTKTELSKRQIEEMLNLFPEGECKNKYLKDIKEYTKTIIKEYSIIDYKWKN